MTENKQQIKISENISGILIDDAHYAREIAIKEFNGNKSMAYAKLIHEAVLARKERRKRNDNGRNNTSQGD